MLSTYNLFDKSIETIRNVISETDQKSFRLHPHVASLVDEIRSICVSNPIKNQRQRLVLCERKMTLFARTFAPYFDIINEHGLGTQDWQGCFWGSIGMVFKVRMERTHSKAMD